MTTKQKIFVKEYIDNGGNGTKAAIKAYNPKTNQTARAIASENLTKPNIQSALAIHNQLIEETILQSVTEYKDSSKQWERTLAIDTAKWVHDKIHGKATQRTEATSQSLIAHISNKPYKV